MKIIITESQNENLKGLLKQVIKSKSVLTAIKSVNGFDNFVKIMDIDSPMDFLHLFDDMDVVQSEEEPIWALFRYKPKHNLMIYDRKNEYVYISYYEIWGVLENNFGLNRREIKELIAEWLGEVYNLVIGLSNIWDYNTSMMTWVGHII